MKLSKTEVALIQRAKQNGGTGGFETRYGRGPCGGRLNHGARQRDALLSLESHGLVTITVREPWQDYNRGYGSGGTIFAYRLNAQA
jgi:hypothetical protein